MMRFGQSGQLISESAASLAALEKFVAGQALRTRQLQSAPADGLNSGLPRQSPQAAFSQEYGPIRR
jgi:hypothetical protein